MTVEDRVVADSGAVLEWVEAHRDQHGWHPGRWIVAERALTVAPRGRSVPVELERDVAQQLVDSPEFALAWELARDLAPLPPRLARVDVMASWEAVGRIIDPKLLLETTYMIREAAIERFVKSEEIARAVCRLVDDVERSVS